MLNAPQRFRHHITTRGNQLANQFYVWVPYHAADSYLAKLVKVLLSRFVSKSVTCKIAKVLSIVMSCTLLRQEPDRRGSARESEFYLRRCEVSEQKDGSHRDLKRAI